MARMTDPINDNIDLAIDVLRRIEERVAEHLRVSPPPTIHGYEERHRERVAHVVQLYCAERIYDGATRVSATL